MSIIVKLLFVGGQPKGEDEPFSSKTHSGKILRRIVKELKYLYEIEVGYYDIWRSAEEERRGILLPAERSVLLQNLKEGKHLIALGHHVHRALQKAAIPVDYFPHPARDSKRLREMLEADIAVSIFQQSP